LGVSVALVIASLGVATSSSAAPGLEVLVQGDCPSQRELEAALIGRGLAIGNSKYLVTTHSDSASVEMTLLRNGTDVVLTRRFSSQDCHAVCEAVAVVVEAYFVELDGMTRKVTASRNDERWLAPPVAESGKSSVAVGTTNANIQQPSRDAQAPLGVTTLPNRTNPPDHNPSKPVGLPASLADAQTTSSAALRGVGFVGAGPALPLPRGIITAQFEAGGGIEFPALPLSIELQLATSWPSSSGGEPNRVRRWASQGVTRVGLPLGNFVHYKPWLGVGLTLAELRALDITTAPSTSTLAAVVGAGLEVAWPLANGWRGRLDLSCLVLTTRDSYRIEPDGEVGRGPRVVCSSMIGIAFGSRSAQLARESGN